MSLKRDKLIGAIMTKSELFKAAHKLTREVIKAGDDYRATFGLCLKFIAKGGLKQKVSWEDFDTIIAFLLSNCKPTVLRTNRQIGKHIVAEFGFSHLEKRAVVQSKLFWKKLVSKCHPDKGGSQVQSIHVNFGYKAQRELKQLLDMDTIKGWFTE